MYEQQIDIQTEEGAMPTLAVCPDQSGSYPAIVLYMDAPAIREELFDMARHMAGQGYYVIIPDLYYRFGHIRFPVRNAHTSIVWRAIMANLSNGMIVDDTRSMLDFLKAQPQVSDGPKGCIGYCMSGRFITAVAGSFPDEFRASASLYGVAIVTAEEDSSHWLVKNIKGEIYYGFAETDSTVPDYIIPTLKDHLDRYGINYNLEIHPGTNHGFCFPLRDVYDEAAAEKVWDVFFAMCARQLKA